MQIYVYTYVLELAAETAVALHQALSVAYYFREINTSKMLLEKEAVLAQAAFMNTMT